MLSKLFSVFKNKKTQTKIVAKKEPIKTPIVEQKSVSNNADILNPLNPISPASSFGILEQDSYHLSTPYTTPSSSPSCSGGDSGGGGD